MAKRSKRAFGRGTPDWLRHIVEKPEQLPFARRLVVALGLGRDGRGAAIALEVAAHVFEVHATHAQLETPGNWADLARSMAARARLAMAHPKLIVKVDLDDDDLAWAALIRLSKPRHDAVEVGACIALSLALLDAMRAKSTLPDKAVPRIASMASACRPDTRRRTRDSWVALTKLISQSSDVTDRTETIRRCLRVWRDGKPGKWPRPRSRRRYSTATHHVEPHLPAVTRLACMGPGARPGLRRGARSGAHR